MNDGIEDLVKATAEAVASLSKLVEGMPRMVDTKLAVYQAAVKDAVASVSEQVESIKAAQADLRGMLHSTVESMKVAMETSGASFSKIIADNHGATIELLEKEVQSLTLRIDDVDKGQAENCKAVEQTLSAAIQNVREECNPTELRATVEAIERKLPSFIPSKIACAKDVQTNINGLNERIASIEKNVSENFDATNNKIIEFMESIPATVGSLIAPTASAMNEQIELLGKSIDALPTIDTVMNVELALKGEIETAVNGVTERVNGIKSVADDLERRATALGSAVQVLDERVAALPTKDTVSEMVGTATAETAAALGGRIEEYRFDPSEMEKSISDFASQLTEDRKSISNEIEQVVKQVGEAAERITAVENRTSELGIHMASNAEINAVAHKGFIERIEQVSKSFGEFGVMVENRIGALDSQIPGIQQVVQDVRIATETGLAALSQAVADAEKLSGENIDKLELELRGHINAVKAGATAALDGLEKRAADLEEGQTHANGAIEAQAGAFINLQNFVATESEIRKRAVLDLEALQKQFSELPAPPEPINVAELEVRLVNKLAEMIPEHASLELPAPEFDFSFDADTLVLSVKWGDETVTRATTLGLGLDYKGVYDKASKYVTGNFVTYKGSMWYARSVPTGEPGKDVTGWQLAVKCGRDGKDATPTRAYDGHENGRVYRETDFLRVNNRLWQCAVKETSGVPEPGDITSTHEWTLIGGVH